MDYKVVVSDTLEDLEKQIIELMEKKYACQGGLFCWGAYTMNNAKWCQAMVKTDA